MRIFNNLRIGTKLAITSGVAVVLVAAMVVMQIIVGNSVREAEAKADVQGAIALAALEAKASARGMQMGVRDILLASSTAELQAGMDYFKARHDSALKWQGEMHKLSFAPENRARIERLAILIGNYAKGTDQIVSQRRQIIEAGQNGGATADVAKFTTEIAKIRKEVTSAAAAELEATADKIVEFAKNVSGQARAAAKAESAWLERFALIASIVVAILLIGSTVLLIFMISRPIRTLASAMSELAAGNYEVTVKGAERGDEVGDVAKTAAVFKENGLAKIRLEREQKEAEVVAAQRRKEEMIKLANAFEAAVGEIVDTVSSASTELEASATTLTATAERSQELATTVAAASEEASTNVQSVASATEELTSSVTEISRQVQESARMATEAVGQARTTNDRVNELSKAASRIGDVVELINTIAGQTNLLALNATIEAARAGEAGRGFAVVASEVKALAEQTAKATGEISQQISGIQGATQESVSAIKEIGGTIERLSEISSTIAAAVEEQGAATQEISRNVQQAAQGTHQVSSNITDVQHGATETGTASSQVLSAAQMLSVDSNRLKVEVTRFLDTVRAA
jgi:methyl-accepting chemotaxis protein